MDPRKNAVAPPRGREGEKSLRPQSKRPRRITVTLGGTFLMGRQTDSDPKTGGRGSRRSREIFRTGDEAKKKRFARKTTLTRTDAEGDAGNIVPPRI